MSNTEVKDVRNVQYSVPSMNKSNTDSMNNQMGYHNMSDRANTKAYPSTMEGAKVNKQPMK